MSTICVTGVILFLEVTYSRRRIFLIKMVLHPAETVQTHVTTTSVVILYLPYYAPHKVCLCRGGGWYTIAPDRALFFSQKVLSVLLLLCKNKCCGTHQKYLIEVLPMSTHNIYCHGEVRKMFTRYPLLSGAMVYCFHIVPLSVCLTISPFIHPLHFVLPCRSI